MSTFSRTQRAITGRAFKFTTPDSADKLYDSDGPTIGLATAIDSIEINFNAKQYVMWNDEECSDRDAAAARWYWRARWKITQTPQVESAQVGLGHIDLSLYTKAEYKKP